VVRSTHLGCGVRKGLTVGGRGVFRAKTIRISADPEHYRSGLLQEVPEGTALCPPASPLKRTVPAMQAE
jgi:hypothetical protein